MAPTSGKDRRLQHELKPSLQSILAGSSHADDGMDEAENDCCASKRVQKRGSPDPDPMHACSGSAEQGPPDCEEKRDPRERPTADQQTELEPTPD